MTKDELEQALANLVADLVSAGWSVATIPIKHNQESAP